MAGRGGAGPPVLRMEDGRCLGNLVGLFGYRVQRPHFFKNSQVGQRLPDLLTCY